MTISDWIMKMAAVTAPKARSDWTAAMAAEFAALKTERLAWALGCLMTAAGWRLRTEAMYLLLVATTVSVAGPVLGALIPFAETLLLAPGVVGSGNFHLLTHLFMAHRLAFYIQEQLITFAISFVLGLWRPDRVVTSGVLVDGFVFFNAYLFFHLVMHTRYAFGLIHWDLPLFGWVMAKLGYCLCGAWLGSITRRALTAQRQVA